MINSKLLETRRGVVDKERGKNNNVEVSEEKRHSLFFVIELFILFIFTPRALEVFETVVEFCDTAHRVKSVFKRDRVKEKWSSGIQSSYRTVRTLRGTTLFFFVFRDNSSTQFLGVIANILKRCDTHIDLDRRPTELLRLLIVVHYYQ
jgi:hypothetical protein